MEDTILLKLEHISKTFDDKMILKDLNLEIRKNEFITLLGPSGCGKTTTLRIIGGFEMPDQGKVIFDGKDITKLNPEKRHINTVFQKYSLFSHMNVAENIAFGLKLKKKDKKYIEEKIRYALKLVDLEGYENRRPTSLSGGQQQRIAIARAIVKNPSILLCDEPTGALDSKNSLAVVQLLLDVRDQIGCPVVTITHNAEMAKVADRVFYMKDGQIQRVEENAHPLKAEELQW